MSYSYETSGLPVLKDLNLNVRYGEIIGIVGNSGSGKTTLLGLASGFLEPSAGKIEYDFSEKTDKKSNDIPSLPSSRCCNDKWEYQGKYYS